MGKINLESLHEDISDIIEELRYIDQKEETRELLGGKLNVLALALESITCRIEDKLRLQNRINNEK